MDNNIFYSVDDDLENYDPEPELEEEEDSGEEKICYTCNGSGESPFSSNGICHDCHGRGTK